MGGKLAEHAGITKRQRHVKQTGEGQGLAVAPTGLSKEQKAKMNEVISKFGGLPLKGSADDQWPASKIVMTHIINALLSSTRISHNISMYTLECLLDAGYHDIDVLRHMSWSARVDLLDSGGFVRYDEKTATYLGELRRHITHKYGVYSISPFPSLMSSIGRMLMYPPMCVTQTTTSPNYY